jgi:hypothetical protein
MRPKQNVTADNIILADTIEIVPLEEHVINEYRELDEKCDLVISKIKDRKKKSRKKNN